MQEEAFGICNGPSPMFLTCTPAKQQSINVTAEMSWGIGAQLPDYDHLLLNQSLPRCGLNENKMAQVSVGGAAHQEISWNLALAILQSGPLSLCPFQPQQEHQPAVMLMLAFG